jgi:hypothetical protein
MAALLDLLDVQTTRFDPVEAEVTFTLPLDQPLEQGQLLGRLLGPRCAWTETVEIAYPLRPLPSEAGLLRSRVVIPEASLWEPAMPFLYDALVEVWDGDRLLDRRDDIAYGLCRLLLHKDRLTLNGHRFLVQGMALKEEADAPLASWRQSGINLLYAEARTDNLDVWVAAERSGFFVLGELAGADDDVLWRVESGHARRVSCFGWVLPVHLTQHPQLWHNAMSLLHGPGRRHLIGVRIEELPFGALPGHVSFLVCERRHLEELEGYHLPRIVLLRRPSQAADRHTWPDSQKILGWIARSSD